MFLDFKKALEAKKSIEEIDKLCKKFNKECYKFENELYLKKLKMFNYKVFSNTLSPKVIWDELIKLKYTFVWKNKNKNINLSTSDLNFTDLTMTDLFLHYCKMYASDYLRQFLLMNGYRITLRNVYTKKPKKENVLKFSDKINTRYYNIGSRIDSPSNYPDNLNYLNDTNDDSNEAIYDLDHEYDHDLDHVKNDSGSTFDISDISNNS